jgi:hypothetical protein
MMGGSITAPSPPTLAIHGSYEVYEKTGPGQWRSSRAPTFPQALAED